MRFIRKKLRFCWTSGQGSAATIAENPLELMGQCAPWFLDRTSITFSPLHKHSQLSPILLCGLQGSMVVDKETHPLHSLTRKHNVRCWHQNQTHLTFCLFCLRLVKGLCQKLWPHGGRILEINVNKKFDWKWKETIVSKSETINTLEFFIVALSVHFKVR